jgi:RimJ/RimL family protein N-acetyltransferase
MATEPNGPSSARPEDKPYPVELLADPADLRAIAFSSSRLNLRSFGPSDAVEVFNAVTPTLTRFMNWDPSGSLQEYENVWRAWLPAMEAGANLHLVIRSASSGELLGVAGLHDIGLVEPELGIWIKESAQGMGYGREAVAAVIRWASSRFGVAAFTWPVAEENARSRRLAEALNGAIVGKLDRRKYTALVYRIPAMTVREDAVTASR